MNGVAFVAQLTNQDKDTWHGYPEAWDLVDFKIKNDWVKAGKVERRCLRTYGTRAKVRDAFGGSL